ncbi:hypothetical protein DIPPA_02073 [Diplonema papillatum]|nr:hypothetical protein DIPPA_02073 [Diplonema papillatum]
MYELYLGGRRIDDGAAASAGEMAMVAAATPAHRTISHDPYPSPVRLKGDARTVSPSPAFDSPPRAAVALVANPPWHTAQPDLGSSSVFESKVAATPAPWAVESRADEVVLTKSIQETMGTTWADNTKLGVPGLVLSQVLPNSAAERSGVERFVGRKLTHINGAPITTVHDIINARGAATDYTTGTQILTLRFSPAPSAAPQQEVLVEKNPGEQLGCGFTPDLHLHMVVPGTPAGRCGLSRWVGQKLVRMNGWPVASLEEVRAITAQGSVSLQFRQEPPDPFQHQPSTAFLQDHQKAPPPGQQPPGFQHQSSTVFLLGHQEAPPPGQHQLGTVFLHGRRPEAPAPAGFQPQPPPAISAGSLNALKTDVWDTATPRAPPGWTTEPANSGGIPAFGGPAAQPPPAGWPAAAGEAARKVQSVAFGDSAKSAFDAFVAAVNGRDAVAAARHFSLASLLRHYDAETRSLTSLRGEKVAAYFRRLFGDLPPGCVLSVSSNEPVPAQPDVREGVAVWCDGEAPGQHYGVLNLVMQGQQILRYCASISQPTGES